MPRNAKNAWKRYFRMTRNLSALSSKLTLNNNWMDGLLPRDYDISYWQLRQGIRKQKSAIPVFNERIHYEGFVVIFSIFCCPDWLIIIFGKILEHIHSMSVISFFVPIFFMRTIGIGMKRCLLCVSQIRIWNQVGVKVAFFLRSNSFVTTNDLFRWNFRLTHQVHSCQVSSVLCSHRHQDKWWMPATWEMSRLIWNLVIDAKISGRRAPITPYVFICMYRSQQKTRVLFRPSYMQLKISFQHHYKL